MATTSITPTYKVRWNKGKAHLSENGKRTFCGKQITGWHWTQDQDATCQEFIKQVHPHCSACAQNAKITILIQNMAGDDK